MRWTAFNFTAGAPLSKMVSVVTVVTTLAVLSNDSQDTVSLVGFR